MADILDVADQNGRTFKYYLDRTTDNANTLNEELTTKLDSPTGTPDGTKFAKDDGTWAVPEGGTGSTITPGTDNTKAAVAEKADGLSAGVVIPESAISEEIVRTVDLPSGSTITPDGVDNTKAAKAVDSDTVNGLTVETAVPVDALFTDTNTDTVYTHPLTHPASIIAQDSGNRFVTDTEKDTWNAKSDFSGSYDDLTDTPVITIPDISGKLDIPTGTADTTTFARGDGTWATPIGTGDMLKSVYDVDDDGKVGSAENADTVNNLTVETAVPSGAVFTDTISTVTPDGTKAAVAVIADTLATDFVLSDTNIPSAIARDSEVETQLSDKVSTGSEAVFASLETTGGDGESRIELVNNTSYTPAAGEYSIFFEGGVLKLAVNGVKSTFGQVETSYLIDQNFEADGYDNGESWTATGTANPDYTADPIAGSQSLNVSGVDTATSPVFEAQSDIWVRAAVRMDTFSTSTNAFLKLRDVSDNTVVALYCGSSGDLGVGTSSGKITAAGVFQAESVVMYLWLHYTVGTGSNGTREAYASTDGVKPAVAILSDTSFDATDDVSKIVLTSSPDANIIFDQLTVSDIELGDF